MARSMSWVFTTTWSKPTMCITPSPRDVPCAHGLVRCVPVEVVDEASTPHHGRQPHPTPPGMGCQPWVPTHVLSPSYGWEATCTLAEPVLVDKDRCPNGWILLANLLQSSKSTFSRGSWLSFFAFKDGMLGTPV